MNCYVPADIMILIDGSDSIQDSDWRNMLLFVKNLITQFDVAEDAIHVENLRHPKGSTNTGKGIAYAVEQFKIYGRPNVPKIMIVITDGSSDNPRDTAFQANRAKNQGIRILAVAITTTPQFTTPMTPNPIIPTVPPPFGLKCNVPADVGFVLDGSSSILDADWIRVKNFVANLINNLEIGRDTIHAGIVVYSTIIGEVINLTPYKQKQTLIYQTTRLKQPKDGTNTARGISKMRQIMNAQGRPNAPKVMVIITDGRSTVPRNTLQEANNAKADGYTIIAVGVGQEAFTTELTQIATNERKVFAVSDFKELTRIIVEIRDLICQGLEKLREIFRTQGRADVPRVGLLITDQASSAPELTKIQANLAKKEGLNMLSLGIGPLVGNREVMEVATDARKVFTTSRFDDLQSILRPVRDMICEVITGSVKVEYNYTELCSGCLFEKGTGFNPYPGDCSRYVKCWVNGKNQVMGAIMTCPFGQFWDSQAMACRPSMNVWCPSDLCKHAPNGFTYGMPQHGCRSYWVCINGASVGSCCPPGTYYLEGMGCMRDTCKAAAYYPFDFDLQDKSEQRTSIGITNVIRSPYGTAQFMGSSRLNLWQYAGMDWNDQLVLQFKFKFDRWGNRYDYGGLVVDMGNGHDWILRILVSGEGSILLRQILQQLGKVNGFQDIRLLLQQLLTMQEMERWIIKHGGGVNNTHITLANWRRFLSTLNVTGGSGTIKDWNIDLIDWGTDGRVIADLWRKFVVQLNPTGDEKRNLYIWSFGPSGTITGNFDRNGLITEMRRALRNKNLVQQWLTFLRNNNIDVASFFRNGGWSTDTNTGYDWLNIIGGGSGTIGGRNIADMWRTFVTEIDVPHNERQSIYTWTFGSGVSGGNVDINGLTEEMKRAINTNSNVRSMWLYFLHRNGIDTSLLRGLGGFIGGTNLGYEWLNWLGGGTGTLGGRNIADLWRSFVRNLRLNSTAKTTIYTWTYGGGTNTDISGLTDEMQRALTDSYIQSLWLVFLRKNNIDVSSLQGNNGWANGYNVGYDWLNWLGGGTGTLGGFSIADLWKNFVLQLNVGPNEKNTIYTWTYGSGGAGDINGLIMEMQNALANSYVRSMWLYYLQMNNIDISSLRVDGGSGTGGRSGFEWLYWFGGGTGNIGGRSIADLWRTFVQQLTLSDQDKMTIFTWTFGNGGNAMDINGLIIEMNTALTNNHIKQLWEQYLLHNNININYDQGNTNFGDGWLKILRGSINGIGGTNLGYEWLNWLGGGTGYINGNSIADLWRSFVLQLNLTVADRTNIYTWTFGAGGQGGSLDVSGLIQEMRLALSNRNIHILWSLFLQGNNIDISSLQGNIGWTAGYNLNYEMLNRIGGGTGTIGVFDIAELWRQFVLQLNVEVNERTTIYTWTFGGGNTAAGGYVDINGLIIEMRRALANSFVRAMWLMYLQKNNIDISSLRVITGNDNAFDWLFWLIGSEGDFGSGGDLSGFYKPPMLYAFGKGFGDAYHKAFIHGLMNRYGGFPLGSGSAEVGGGASNELNSILNNLQGSSVGGAHRSSSSSSSGSTELGVGAGGGGGGLHGGILLDEDIFGFDLFRKKRDTSDDKKRKKRQADPRFVYQTLVSDCPDNNRRPSINIAANERSVKLHLASQSNPNGAELDLPVVPGWNEVTLVYDGRNMHGMVQNWRGKQHQKVPLNGKIPRSASGLSIGGCPSSTGFVGQVDDLIAYKCVPQALTSTFGMK
ncbi:hypothetical protein KUTeg_011129 [Tegillarca granosa]|uniref:Uncharacterized protein n=1 Tax=Tegillarca granosa TaxID=220873 RepID=A0ABQ9F1P3_TEGGR|nr:hypothetical protein KUTeg_011129 [Tegillarca granosa]